MASPSNPRNAFENAVFALGLLLVAALVGALVWEAVARPSGPPALTATVGAPAAGGTPVTVRNDGGTAAEAVRVEVCAGATCGEVEVPYVPVGAAREATVGVAGDSLTARVVSFLAM